MAPPVAVIILVASREMEKSNIPSQAIPSPQTVPCAPSKATKEPTPYQVVSGSGDAWYFSPQDKKMVRVQRGSEILVLSKESDIPGKVYVTDSSSKIFLMPTEEIIDIGYN